MKIFFKILLTLLILLVVSTAAGYGLLKSDGGKKFLTEKLGRLTHGKVDIQNLSGDIFSEFSIASVTLKDNKGIWLEINDLKINWIPKALIEKQPIFKSIDIEELKISRFPEDKKRNSSSSFDLKKYMNYLPQHISVNRIILPSALTANNQELTLSGDLHDNYYDLSLKTIKGADTNLTAHIKADNENIDANLKLKANDLSIIPTPANLGLAGKINSEFSASGPVGAIILKGYLAGHDLYVSGRRIYNFNFQLDTKINSLEQKPADALNISSSTLVINTPQGKITANGTLLADQLNFSLKAKNFDMQFLPLSNMPKTTLGLALNLTGKAENPIIDMKSDLKIADASYPVTVSSIGKWQEGELTLNLNAKSNKASFTASSTMKAKLSLLPFHTDLNKETEVSAKSSGSLPLDMLNTSLRPIGHRISGMLNGGIDITGNIGTPKVKGDIRLSNGEYENAKSGICLHNISSEISANENELNIVSLTANDRTGGNMQGNTKLSLDEIKTLSGNIGFNHLRLFCGGLATGYIEGNMGISGTLAAAMLKGNFTVGPLNVQIPGKRNEQGIPEVKTVWIENDLSNKSDKPIENKTAKSINVDIDVNAPNRIFVRGRGVDAEFYGNFHIIGTADKPVITGNLTAKRGKFNLFDRVLTLKDTSIIFEGIVPPSPVLNVNAETVVKDTTIDVNLTGPLTSPTLTLTSTPVLPQDELLALILFGRQIDNISPFQAIKLANAARTLAGEDDDSNDILSKSRDKLGLDTLDIETDENSNATLNSGKYLTDKVYVGVSQGQDIENRQLTTEVEVAPKISAKTSVDSKGGQTLGLEWKQDY